jgi:TetR/AcrR family transcriptional regulator
MNIEARQDTDRLAYIYDTYIAPTLAPIGRLLDHCASHGRTRPISLRAFHFLLAHGGAAPFTLAPLARHFEPTDPLEPAAAQEHADLIADLLVHALERDPAHTAETRPAA